MAISPNSDRYSAWFHDTFGNEKDVIADCMAKNLNGASHEGDSPGILSLTILRSTGAPVQKTLVLTPDGRVEVKGSYPHKTTFWLREVIRIGRDIDALRSALKGLSTRRDCCLVTGSAVGPLPLDTPARRLKAPRDDHPATLAECSAAWLPIDCDKIPLDSPLDPIDPEPAIASVVERLGQPFCSTSYVWTLTASASPGADRISARVFFLVDRDIDNAARKAWALGLNGHTGVSLVDTALFSATQPIYTAAPAFIGHDPFPRRIGVVYGERELLPWADVTIHENPQRDYSGTEYRGAVHRSITELLAVIGDGPGQEGFHVPMRDAIWQMVWHRWIPERIKAVIRQTVFAADQRNHDLAYLERETSDRALAASIRGAAQRIAESGKPARVTQTRMVDDPVTLDEASRRIAEVTGEWVRGEGPTMRVLDVTVGVGKTHTAVEQVIENLPAGANLLWAFPTHRQGQEVVDKLNKKHPRFAIKIEARISESPDRESLCRRPDLIREINAAGLRPYTASLACKNGKDECPHFLGCAYYSQFAGPERVRLMAHDYLQHTKARVFQQDFMESCVGLIVDESPLGKMVGHKSFALGPILEASGVLADVLRAWQAGGDVADLTEALEAEMRERCAQDLPTHTPKAADEWGLLRELKALAAKKKPSLGSLYRAVIARLGGAANLVWFGQKEGQDAVFVAWKHELPAVERVLVLDGTADRDAYAALLGDAEVVRIHVQQNLEILQATDLPMGKSKLTDPKKPGTLAQVVALARGAGYGLITNKSAIDAAVDRGWLPDEHPRGHFNSLRGMNAMADLPGLVIAGRPEPDALVVEAHARALWPREALKLSGRYQWSQDGVSSVAAHPDGRCDGLLRMCREAEVQQAIGRLRAVRSPIRKRVILLGHTPTGLPVEARRFDDLVPPVPLARLLLAGNGVAPLVPALMSEMVPECWSSVDSAKAWLKRERVSLCLGRYIYKGNDTLKFRCEGQRCPSKALTWLDYVFDAWENLERLSGRRVVDCQRTVEPPPSPDWQAMSVVVRSGVEPTVAVGITHILAPELSGRQTGATQPPVRTSMTVIIGDPIDRSSIHVAEPPDSPPRLGWSKPTAVIRRFLLDAVHDLDFGFDDHGVLDHWDQWASMGLEATYG